MCVTKTPSFRWILFLALILLISPAIGNETESLFPMLPGDYIPGFLSDNLTTIEPTESDAIEDPEYCCLSLRITSAPSGAQLSINGRFMGYTPKNLEYLLPGLYHITLVRDGYETWQRTIYVSPDKDNSYYIVLEPLFAPITSGTVFVISNPAGAGITLDETLRGVTPRTLTLGEGSHSLTLNMDGYQPYTTRFFLRDGENLRMDISLIPAGNIITPVIVAATNAPDTPLIHDLESLGDKAAGLLQRKGLDSLIEEINNPDGQLQQNGAYVTVLSVNGTLLADPTAFSMAEVTITDIHDQNEVSYGALRIAAALSGGGLLYESDIANTTDGEVLISSVRPVTDEGIIAVSYRPGISLPETSSKERALLISGTEISSGSESSRIQEITIPLTAAGSDDDGNGNNYLTREDGNGIIPLTIIEGLAQHEGGFCYIPDPYDPAIITLAYVSPEKEGTSIVRWISGEENSVITGYEKIDS